MLKVSQSRRPLSVMLRHGVFSRLSDSAGSPAAWTCLVTARMSTCFVQHHSSFYKSPRCQTCVQLTRITAAHSRVVTMSKSEQDALLAYCNTFKLARRVNTFASLADGKVLMEVRTSLRVVGSPLIRIGHVADVSSPGPLTTVRRKLIR